MKKLVKEKQFEILFTCQEISVQFIEQFSLGRENTDAKRIPHIALRSSSQKVK